MTYILHNFLPIAAATLAGMLVGLIWLRASALLLPSWKTLAVAGVAEFWLASILAGALILAPPEAGAWTMAIGSAVVIWIGFVLPVLAVTFMVYKLEGTNSLSASLHWLAVMLVQAVVMQGIGLVAP